MARAPCHTIGLLIHTVLGGYGDQGHAVISATILTVSTYIMLSISTACSTLILILSLLDMDALIAAAREQVKAADEAGRKKLIDGLYSLALSLESPQDLMRRILYQVLS